MICRSKRSRLRGEILSKRSCTESAAMSQEMAVGVLVCFDRDAFERKLDAPHGNGMAGLMVGG